MTKSQIKALVAAKIAGQGTAVDAGSVLPAILNGIADLVAVETPFTISSSGSTEGSTTTYDVTTDQSEIDAFIEAAQTKPLEALPVVNDNGAVIRFTKIEVADGTVTGHCRIDGGTYALHLINTALGGDSYFSHTTD